MDQNEQVTVTNSDKVLGDWIKANVGTLIVIAVLIVGMVVQWAKFSNASDLAAETSRDLHMHELDTLRHMDPLRWTDLTRRLDRIEQKLDRIENTK